MRWSGHKRQLNIAGTRMGGRLLAVIAALLLLLGPGVQADPQPVAPVSLTLSVIEDIPAQIKKLAELKAAGILSEGEFAEKKRSCSRGCSANRDRCSPAA